MEVTVYVTEVFWPDREPEKHEFCNTCYAEAEAERSERFRARFNAPTIPDIDPERMTALEYLDACERAVRNGPNNPVIRRLMNDLAKHPAAQQRLAFEMLPIIWQRLEAGQDAGPSMTMMLTVAGVFWGQLERQRSEEYASWAEKIIFRCYERSGSGTEALHMGGYGYQIGASVMLMALHKVDPLRFARVLETLKGISSERGLDSRWEILAKAEKLISAKKPPIGS